MADFSDSDYNRKCDIDKHYKFYKKVNNDTRYGEYTILKSSETGKFIMMKEKVLNTKETINTEITNARERTNISSPYLLNTLDYSTEKISDFCSTFYKIRSFNEFASNDLQREQKDRASKGDRFSMEELTHILYNMIYAGSYLQQNQRHHGDIRPCYIHMEEDYSFNNSNSTKGYQLGDRMNEEITSEQNQINIIAAGKSLYMSPALFVGLKKNNLQVSHNSYKSDVFALGLCILEAGLMKPVNVIYDENSGQF